MTFISDLTIIAPPEALAVSAEIMILFFLLNQSAMFTVQAVPWI